LADGRIGVLADYDYHRHHQVLKNPSFLVLFVDDLQIFVFAYLQIVRARLFTFDLKSPF
jgi:hypothetical protein